MDPSLIRSLLIIVWWIGVWGLSDLLIHSLSKNNTITKAIIYFTMILLVLGTVAIKPSMVNHI